MNRPLLLAGLLAALLTACGPGISQTTTRNHTPAEVKTYPGAETAVLAAGCFWCMEAIFEAQPGVLDVVSGYAGGDKANPTYEEVCAENTGHAEAVLITFDPQKTSLAKLLDVYWKSFDPTDGRGVAPDFGSSYRPVIFYADEAQKNAAEASKSEVQKGLSRPIAVEIVPLAKFWPAEEYHQDFARRNPNHPYVRNVTNERLDRVGVPHP